jgi:protein-L-isoaspartate O-methyltransferase
MLWDDRRTDRVTGAMQNTQLRGKTISEIGAGEGLIAALFAKSGASRVEGIEANRQLARAAALVIQANGLSDVGSARLGWEPIC